MLKIAVSATELWDEKREEFFSVKPQVLTMEHSLVSISKWEAKWCKPFLSDKPKDDTEVRDYIRCMTTTQNVDPMVFYALSNRDIARINEYIAAPMTATWFSEDRTGTPRKQQITSELIYYWMIALRIPFECQKWHLNRLLTLIRVCNIKNQPPKKRSKREILSRNAALNAARRQQLNSRG